MATWGATTIKFSYSDYSPPSKSGGFTRIDLLPSATSPTEPAQAIQQFNTGLKQVSGTLILSSYAEYLALEVDMINGTSRTLVAPGETGDTYYIEELGTPDYRKSGLILVNATFVQAYEGA